MALHGNMMLAPAGGYSGYQIDNSMLLDGSSQYLSWTPGGAGSDNTRFTFRCMLKVCDLDPGLAMRIFSAGTSANDRTEIFYLATNEFRFFQSVSGIVSQIDTAGKFRDPGSWYDLCIVYNSNEASSTDRLKIFVNGIQQDTTETNAIESARAVNFGAATPHKIGAYAAGPSDYFNGNLAKMYFCDGQAYEATEFGEFWSGNDKAWRPISPSGLTYGTNGFHLDFSNGADLGEDQAGSNDWTANGSPTQSSDSPTVNYATANPLINIANGALSNGNLSYNRGSTASHDGPAATICLPPTGKWYWEVIANVSANQNYIGVADIQNNPQLPGSSALGSRSGDYAYQSNGNKYNNSSSAAYGATYTAADVIGVAWNSDDGEITFYKNNSSQGVAYSSIPQEEGRYAPSFSEAESSGTIDFVFADDDLTYSPPTGYLTLSAANLPEVTITDPGEHFNAVAYTGDGTAIGSGGNAITGVGFQSDFSWLKRREDAGYDHLLFDVLRGPEKIIYSSSSSSEDTNAETLSSFDSDGFTLGNDAYANATAKDYISWNWKAGNSSVANSDGSISSTVSVNDDAGFSIVSYTGTGSAATVGHGQSAAPEMIILKNLADVESWSVYHNGVASDPETDLLYLNLTNAAIDNVTYWNDTAPTSSIFSIGTDNQTNGASDDFIAYCFRSIPGYSKVFSYTGNGSSSGPFVWLGFKPRWIMVKRTDSAHNWPIWDTERDPVNDGAELNLNADANDAENSDPSLDFLSNGWKARGTGLRLNASGGTYIGIAFAENPFGGSNIPLGLAQ